MFVYVRTCMHTCILPTHTCKRSVYAESRVYMYRYAYVRMIIVLRSCVRVRMGFACSCLCQVFKDKGNMFSEVTEWLALYGIFVYQLPRNNDDVALSLEKNLSTEKTSRFRFS